MIRALLLALLLTAGSICSAEEWTARPDGLYNPAGEKVAAAIQGAFERSDFSKQERRALIFSVVGMGLDIYTTRRGISRGGCSELNPLFDKTPKTGALIAVGVVQTGVLYWVMQRDKADNSKAGLFAGGVHMLAAGWNATRKCNR